MTLGRPQHLRLVPAPVSAPTQNAPSAPTTQRLLFAMPEPNMLCFVDIATAEHAFNDLVVGMRPKWVFDLRTAPRLDFAGRTRRQTLDNIVRAGGHYVDVFGIIGVTHYQDAAVNSPFLANSLNEIMLEIDSLAGGPCVFLCDRREILKNLSETLPTLIQPRPKKGWSVSIIGSEGTLAAFG